MTQSVSQLYGRGLLYVVLVKVEYLHRNPLRWLFILTIGNQACSVLKVNMSLTTLDLSGNVMLQRTLYVSAVALVDSGGQKHLH